MRSLRSNILAFSAAIALVAPAVSAESAAADLQAKLDRALVVCAEYHLPNSMAQPVTEREEHRRHLAMERAALTAAFANANGMALLQAAQ